MAPGATYDVWNSCPSRSCVQHGHGPMKTLAMRRGRAAQVRPGWLQALYQLAVAEQGAWMVGSLQQHNRKMYGHNDYYHINGNALHRFDSEAYRMFLRRARLAHPNVFDYAVMIERMQGGAAHAHIGQMVTHRIELGAYGQTISVLMTLCTQAALATCTFVCPSYDATPYNHRIL